jgi:hypothetical protein
MEGFGANNTKWISALFLSTGFYQEPETTDRSNGRNAKAEALNSFLL